MIHNIIVGKLWIDQHGEMTITNHTTKQTCTMEFIPYSYFSSAEPRQVKAKVKSATGAVMRTLSGTWDKELCMDPHPGSASPTVLWTRTPALENVQKMFGFTVFSCTLNEMTVSDKGCASTDARFRLDKNLMEQGRWDDANRIKVLLTCTPRASRIARVFIPLKLLCFKPPTSLARAHLEECALVYLSFYSCQSAQFQFSMAHCFCMLNHAHAHVHTHTCTHTRARMYTRTHARTHT